MGDKAKIVFRNAPEASVAHPDGTVSKARGLVARMWGQGDRLSAGEPHESGGLESPLYLFTGWAEKAGPGDVLKQGGGSYTVLRAEDMAVGGMRIAARLLLERQVVQDDGP